MYYKLCKIGCKAFKYEMKPSNRNSINDQLPFAAKSRSYLLRCRSTGFRLFLESADREKQCKFIWPSSIWPRVGFNGNSCINVRCMLVSKFSRTIWLCIWGQGDRDPLKKSKQTFPIFLAGSNMHMESLLPRPTDQMERQAGHLNFLPKSWFNLFSLGTKYQCMALHNLKNGRFIYERT